MKIRCRCGQLAVWSYMPSGCDSYYCDECIKRGCSCNIDPDSGIEYQDELGRKLPCCEYDYSERGYENDKVLDDSDLYDTDFDEY